MFIIKYRKIWYVLATYRYRKLVFHIQIRLEEGIDFTGGALLELEYAVKPDVLAVKQKIEELSLGSRLSSSRPGQKHNCPNERSYGRTASENFVRCFERGQGKEIRFDSIGPVIGKELKKKSVTAMILVIVMIILYIAFAFRKVSQPVNSFYYGLMAVVALIHDVTLPAGVFAALGHYYGVEVDTLFVTALLTVLGFSVHDTIVVFDRIRENLRNSGNKNNFGSSLSALSVNQTVGRSINTSLTVILVLLAIFFLGGESTKYFSLALLIGVSIGTYSSIFLASPLLVTLQKLKKRKKLVSFYLFINRKNLLNISDFVFQDFDFRAVLLKNKFFYISNFFFDIPHIKFYKYKILFYHFQIFFHDFQVFLRLHQTRV